MADHRHKRDTDARWNQAVSRFTSHGSAARFAAPVAVLATVGVVGAGVLAATPAPTVGKEVAASSPLAASISMTERAAEGVSRSQDRTEASRLTAFEAAGALGNVQNRLQARQDRLDAAAARKATAAAVANADTRLWTTTELNLWTSSAGGSNVGLLDAEKKVLVTGRHADGRVEVVVDGESRWVTAGYLTEEKPEPTAAGASLGGVCSNGSSIPGGRPALYEIHDVVCANWPQITAYGTYRGDGEHSQGRAIDIMVSGSTGWEVAEFLRSNYSALGIEYIIYSQKIWSVERSGEGWRYMSDRGSTTANHYDHVHVTVF